MPATPTIKVPLTNGAARFLAMYFGLHQEHRILTNPAHIAAAGRLTSGALKDVGTLPNDIVKEAQKQGAQPLWEKWAAKDHAPLELLQAQHDAVVTLLKVLAERALLQINPQTSELLEQFGIV